MHDGRLAIALYRFPERSHASIMLPCIREGGAGECGRSRALPSPLGPLNSVPLLKSVQLQMVMEDSVSEQVRS